MLVSAMQRFFVLDNDTLPETCFFNLNISTCAPDPNEKTCKIKNSALVAALVACAHSRKARFVRNTVRRKH